MINSQGLTNVRLRVGWVMELSATSVGRRGYTYLASGRRVPRAFRIAIAMGFGSQDTSQLRWDVHRAKFCVAQGHGFRLVILRGEW